MKTKEKETLSVSARASRSDGLPVPTHCSIKLPVIMLMKTRTDVRTILAHVIHELRCRQAPFSCNKIVASVGDRVLAVQTQRTKVSNDKFVTKVLRGIFPTKSRRPRLK